MESEFPSNSKNPKGPIKKDLPEKKIEKVVTGEVQTRKKPLGKRFRETFAGADSKSVLEYVVMDVMVPAAKDMIADAVSQGVERKLFGEVRSSSRRAGGYGGFRPGGQGFTAYNRMGPPGGKTREPMDPRGPSTSRRARSHNFDEIILATRAEANEVLDQLYSVISQYEVASVADLYEMVELPSNFTDNKWGWTDLRGAEITRVRMGYLLDLPRPEPID